MESIASVDLEDSAQSHMQCCKTYQRVPDSDLQRARFNFFKQDRLRPSPSRHEAKELADNDSSCSRWVELTYPGNHHCPRNSTRKAHDVGIYGST